MKFYLFFFTLPIVGGFRINNDSLKYKQLKLNMLPSKQITNGVTEFGVPWSYTDLINFSKDKLVASLSISEDGKNAVAFDKAGDTSKLHLVQLFPDNLNSLLDHLIKNNVNVDVLNIPKSEFFEIINKFGEAVFNISIYFLAIYLIFNVFFGLSNLNFEQSNRRFGGTMLSSLQNNNINEFDGLALNTTFSDVAGCDESKFELMEVVDFLKNKEKYDKAGAKIPKGVLLEGPPGTGKTLLARAVAGEAGVPFLSVSGSEFIEVFVGVGASRVRSLFEKAKQKQPCVVFIDEIDAIGRKRGAGIAGGNDEREQTLNQILTNMDGFSSSEGIVVIAATNRIDILDQALTRPGRFDRKVAVGLPDMEGRKEIMKVHFGNKNVESDVDYNEIATLTPGFSGADIANLANEAAIFSVRVDSEKITRTNILDAYEKITIGLVSKTQTADKYVIELVSNHEIGHALMVAKFKDLFDLRKVTINENKSGAGGYTLFTPKDRFQKYPTKKFMLANLIVALGGRAAEVFLYRKQSKSQDDENIFGCFTDLEVTTGASNDLKQASNIARKYITEYGFGKFLGTQEETNNSEAPFLGRDVGIDPNKVSDDTKTNIDMQVNELLEFAFNQSYNIIKENEDAFIESVNLVIKNRVLSGKDIYALL